MYSFVTQHKPCRHTHTELITVVKPLIYYLCISIYLPIMSNPCWGPRHMSVIYTAQSVCVSLICS